MRYRICFVLLLVTATLYTNRADAQFWKNWFHKKETKKYPAHKSATKVKPKPSVKKPAAWEYPASVKKTRYRIDFFAPLYLDELIKNNKSVYKGRLPEKAVTGLDFYEGVKLAADTLNAMGYSIDIYTHDVTQERETPEWLIAHKALDSSDLFIGCVHNNKIPALAAFARKKNINFISAYSPSDAGITDNPFFVMIQPSLDVHCNWIMDHIDKKYKGKDPLILYRTTGSLDSEAFAALNADSSVPRISFNYYPTKEKLAKSLDSTGTNLVVMPILSVSEAEKILLQLNTWFPNYQFVVYGMPSWRSMPSIKKPEAFPNIAVYITAPFYFDMSTGPGQALANMYKQDIGGTPGEMVFRGYETTYWFSYLLSKYGTVFNTKFKDDAAAPFTRFDIRQQKNEDGKIMYLENEHIYLYRYQSSSYMVEQ